MSEEETPQQYALRILPRAERDINIHVSRLAEVADPETARLWYQGLFETIATLAEHPRRFAVIGENRRFRREVRQILYRRTPSGQAWRILFTIDESADDAPTVSLLHIRHGAQRPITPTEARQIEASEQ